MREVSIHYFLFVLKYCPKRRQFIGENAEGYAEWVTHPQNAKVFNNTTVANNYKGHLPEFEEAKTYIVEMKEAK